MKRINLYILLIVFTAAFHQAKAQTFKETSDSLLYYYQLQQFDKAIPFAEKTVVIVKERFGTENAVYAKYLNLLAGLYVGNFQFPKAEQVLLEMNALNKKLAGTGTKEYNDGISVLAIVYNNMGKDDKAIPYLVEAMQYQKSQSGDTSIAFISAANRLAKVYESLGEYEKAVEIFTHSMEILAKAKGAGELSYATSMNNLGIVYKNMGHPEKAEPLMLRAMGIRKGIDGEASDEYANSLNNLAVLYSGIGQHKKAKEYYDKAAGIFKKIKGAASAEYITCLTNLGSEYDILGEYEKAEETLLNAMAIAGKAYDEDWPQRMIITKNIGQLYLAMEQFSKAEPLLLKVSDNEKSKKDSGAYAGSLNDLAYLYAHTNRPAEAELLYKRSAALTSLSLGSMHEDHAATLNNLAFLYLHNERYNDAIPVLSEANKITEFNLLNLFAIFSEEEKANYMATNIFLQQTNLSLLYDYPAAPASFYRENYNIQLLIKSLLLTDTKNVLEAIRTSKDTAIKTDLLRWEKNKKILAREYSLPGTKRMADLQQLENETENLEKDLVRLSSAFRDMRSGIGVKMEDVQLKLYENEAAIEFVSFPLFKKDITDSIMYGAFILKKNDISPVFVPLFEEKQLLSITGKAGNTSKVFVNNLYPGKSTQNSTAQQLYNLVWQPLEPWLKGIKKIAYSPSGKLYSIAFHALSADTTSILMDRYQLYQYTSTKQLMQRDTGNMYTRPASAALFGNAVFSLDSLQLSRLKKNPSAGFYIPENNGMNAQGWPALPGTEEEIKQIKKLFDINKIPSGLYTKLDASEENLKELSGRSPQSIFIATHGFFIPEKKKDKNIPVNYGRNVLAGSSDPLMRSGLALSGVNYAWSGKTPIDGIEDGIVTAYEISQLNLSTTDLVVLSACETGLGDIKGTEGVFGLQRAFKMAGVKRMIVSLWKVPDKETAELMTSFYTYWFRGKTVDEAFSSAQEDMRKKYPPYYWAAFVLVE